LEKKLKAAEDAHVAAEVKLDELRAQTAEREEALTARLNSMVEDLTGMPYDISLSALLNPSPDA
jgi:hypothetical protein